MSASGSVLFQLPESPATVLRYSISLPLSSTSSILLPIAVKTPGAAQVSCPTPNPGLRAPRCHGALRLPLTGPHLPVGVHSLWWQHREGVASMYCCVIVLTAEGWKTQRWRQEYGWTEREMPFASIKVPFYFPYDTNILAPMAPSSREQWRH